MSQVSKRLIDINMDGNKSTPETRNLVFGLRAPKLGDMMESYLGDLGQFAAKAKEKAFPVVGGVGQQSWNDVQDAIGGFYVIMYCMSGVSC
jgi:hypothetical protein